MNTFIGLLRGINVGGQNRLPMGNLRELCQAIGLLAEQTYLQSGNIVFQAEEQTLIVIANRIEESIQQSFGFKVTVFVSRVEYFQRILSLNPFLNHKQVNPAKLYVTFLYREPTQAAWRKVIAPKGITDEFSQAEQAIYIFCPNGYGKTKLSNGFFEKKLGVPATTRNWNTVSTLFEMAKG